MIRELLKSFATTHGYRLVENKENVSFLMFSLRDKKRFLVLYENDKLPTPQALNELIIKLSPEVFKLDPAFERNTDLIFLYPLKHRADFKNIESQVFNIEENPYYFKKYFLYYSDDELDFLKGESVDSISKVATDVSSFSKYREDPLSPSIYSIVARIFIKTPFLKISSNSEQLKPLNLYLEEGLKEDDMYEFYQDIEYKKESNLSPENLIKDLVDETLENIKD